MVKCLNIFLRMQVFLFALLFCSKTKGQVNLVMNPSFESYTACPTGLDQITAQDWKSYRESPDFYHTCGINGMAPPNCLPGFQNPHSGNAMCGLVSYSKSTPNYREILGGVLNNSLVINEKYYFSFYLSMASSQGNTLSANKLGLRFSTVPFSKIIPVAINKFAHFYTSSKISDTVGWVKLKGSFIADSNYKFIMVGNFFDDFNTDTSGISNYNIYSYYYVDDICISNDSLFTETWTSLPTLAADSNYLLFIPNPVNGPLKFTPNCHISKVTCCNSLGQEIFNQINIDKEEITIKFKNSGIYYLKVESAHTMTTKVIICENP